MFLEKSVQTNPYVGIIIPIYNVEPYLRECLDSVVNQTYQNLQIVLVDDGSTDASFSIAKEYFDRDERIALIKREKNGGMGASRNSALDYLSQSSGGGGIQILEHSPSKSVEYIHFLDSDDWLELDCIEKCVDIALRFQAQIVWHGCKHFYEATQEIKESDFPKCLGLEEKQVYSGLEIFSKLPFSSFSWVWQGLIAVWLAQEIRFEEGIESEDAIFGMQTFALAQKICLIFDNFYNYRIRPNSASQHTLKNKNAQGISFPPHQRDIIEAFDDIFTIRHYRFAYSCAIISLRIDRKSVV